MLSPKVDFVFKRIFGNENNPRILISFLNAVIKPKDPIQAVQIMNNDIDKESIEDKFSRLDIKAKTNKNELINIEIQIKDEHNMVKRSIYYWSKMFESQLTEGKKYDTLAKTICINILNFKCLKTKEAHSIYRLKEINTNEELTDLQEIHFIELPKLPKNEEIKDVFDAWMEFIENPISNKLEKAEMTIQEIKEAKNELLRLSANDKERMKYEDRRAALLDKVSALENAEEKGIKIGKEIGKEIGKKEGEQNKAIEVAKNSLKAGLDIDTISSITGLERSEIEKLL
ncbi:Rpn family recombination-promoting nuclease/putative transposase [Clostridium sp. K04]|nr:Rpn family recombination-promoting nuclease/putative transposase [Clostridium sp. K04]